MEYNFSSKEKGTDFWASTSTQSDVDSEARNSTEPPYDNITELMTLDGYGGWFSSPSTTEQLLAATYGFSSLMPSNYGSCDQLNFTEQNSSVFSMNDNGSSLNPLGSPLNYAPFSPPVGLSEGNDSDLVARSRIPRPIGLSLPERMLRALSLFKEASGGGILAQVWVPIRSGDHYILSTCDQPYLLDQMLLGYREVSRSYTFSIEQSPGSFPGLPGRVFTSKIPEWTSNVGYYSSAEYLRVKHAIDHEVRGSVALPVFSPAEGSCCAVLELVTVREKPNFDLEMETVCRALEAVDLRTTAPPRLHPQCLSINQRSALTEITDVLRTLCHAHRLPLALTWIPCTLVEDGDNIMSVQVRECNSNLNKKGSVLCIEESACYVNDKEMQGFVHACVEHPLEEGQGVAGKAFQSNLPFFYPDVKTYHINEYPLVQHARKFGLAASVAIRLRSIHGGNDDYVLEFFLPVSMKGTKEQQLLLDSLSGTMQRICRSLRTVAEGELASSVDNRLSQSFFPRDVAMMNSQPSDVRSELIGINKSSVDVSSLKNICVEGDASSEQASGSRRQTEKKRSTSEKTVSLSVLQQYFSGSLKDAAKSIGVCPTTLKRICRQHGISRWPSRKINKVNRSLKKIQIVLDSVEGVEGGLKFDPKTGELVAGGSIIQESDTCKALFLPSKITPPKNPESTTKQDMVSFTPSSPFFNTEICTVKLEKDSYMPSDCVEELRKSTFDVGSFDPSSFKAALDEMDLGLENENGVVEHNQPSCSGTTDSSIGSGSLSSSPSNTDKGKESKDKTSVEECGSKITVKATYREDTIRFKFEPSCGCLHLYEEVANRFKLQLGSFQLKYLDDEEEWVILISDSDLQECLEIMEFVGKKSVKFLVRDLPCGMGSSGSSNFL